MIDDQELPRFVERWMPPSLPHRSRPDASKSNACKSTCGGVTVDHELPEFVERRPSIISVPGAEALWLTDEGGHG